MISERILIIIFLVLFVQTVAKALPHKIKGRVQIAQSIENQNYSDVYFQLKRLWQVNDKYSFDVSGKVTSIFDNKNKIGRRIYKVELGFNF